MCACVRACVSVSVRKRGAGHAGEHKRVITETDKTVERPEEHYPCVKPTYVSHLSQRQRETWGPFQPLKMTHVCLMSVFMTVSGKPPCFTRRDELY